MSIFIFYFYLQLLQNGSDSNSDSSRRRQRRHSDSHIARDFRRSNTSFSSTPRSKLERQRHTDELSLDLHNEDKTDTSNSSFQSTGSSAQDNIPTQLLETPRKEVVLPDVVTKDNIKVTILEGKK